MPQRRAPLAALLLLLALLAAGCLQSPPTNYHTLVPIGPPAAATPPRAALLVGLEPVTLPAAFERNEILLMRGPNDLEPAPGDAWIGPLDQMVSLVVAEGLAGHLGLDQVFLLPTRRFVDLDRIVEVDIVRLVTRVEGTVELEAVWRIFDARERLVRTGRTTATEGFAPGATLTPAVAAIDRTLDRLSRALARAVAAAS